VGRLRNKVIWFTSQPLAFFHCGCKLSLLVELGIFHARQLTLPYSIRLTRQEREKIVTDVAVTLACRKRFVNDKHIGRTPQLSMTFATISRTAKVL